MKLWKFDSGIYPVIPGMNIILGDYGFWDGSQWCHVGNIEKLSNFRNVLSIIRKKDLNQSVSECLEVDVKGESLADMEISNLKAGAEIVFKKKNSQLFIGNLKECEYYGSIGMEIEPLLRQLYDIGIWKSEYWLAYYVMMSDSFFTMRSKSAGVSVKVNADFQVKDLQETGVALTAKLSFADNSIECVAPQNNQLSFAGAKFKRNVKLKYNTADPDEIMLV